MQQKHVSLRGMKQNTSYSFVNRRIWILLCMLLCSWVPVTIQHNVYRIATISFLPTSPRCFCAFPEIWNATEDCFIFETPDTDFCNIPFLLACGHDVLLGQEMQWRTFFIANTGHSLLRTISSRCTMQICVFRKSGNATESRFHFRTPC